jgi:hypothetical protein
MRISDLRPARTYAQQYGVKAIAYGPAGSGKTPLINTAPRPVICMCEPGFLSMRDSNVPTFEAFTVKKIVEFFDWIESSDCRNFDTICIDSGSELADIVLKESIAKNRHGLKAYGDMAEFVTDKLKRLYHLREKHVYITCKLGATKDDTAMQRPYFPGQELNVTLPHLYDAVLYIGKEIVPNHGQQNVIRTAGTYNIIARDRSGKLAEVEPMHLGALFHKIMQ